MTALGILAVLAILFSGIAFAGEIIINGAGATFPYPLYSQWADKYNKITGMKMNYQSIGSGGGIAQIKAKTVDFGATDAPLKSDELEKEGLVQFPMVIGGVVPVINVKGINAGELRLTPELLAAIFLGKITKWNDEKIRKVNPSLKLPSDSITVVHRADGSGTTWIYTNYLDKISQEWHQTVGTDKAVKWPVGVGGKGNEGVAAYVQQVNGSIGYVEYAYALQNKMAHVQLENRAVKFVNPTIESFQAAAQGADWKNAPGYYLVLTDQPGDASWPITGASFILIHRDQKDMARGKAMVEFFNWCLKNGEKIAMDLFYVPMPQTVVAMVENTWGKDLRSAGKVVWNRK